MRLLFSVSMYSKVKMVLSSNDLVVIYQLTYAEEILGELHDLLLWISKIH
uniref:Uncharacterized protein n=1 Tax=Arundo donax TaxID=35708 RepID=A0A0A9F2T7_ARUDO